MGRPGVNLRERLAAVRPPGSLGLRGRIVAIAFLAMVTVALVVTLTSSFFFTERQTRSQLARTQAIARGLALQLERILALGITVRELQGFQDQCTETVAHHEGLSFAMVLGLDERVLFESEPASRLSAPRITALMRLAERAGGQAGASIEDPQEHFGVALAPARGTDGTLAAWVMVGFPRDTIIAERNELLRQIALTGLLALALGVAGMGVVLSRGVTRPLAGVVQTLEALRTGRLDYSARLPDQRGDELGVLSRGFNRLLETIAERERELVTSREAALQASKAKTEFLAVMSHEMRTPLNALIGMADLLQTTPLDERQRKFATVLSENGRTLMALISDVLDVSRIEAGRFSIVPAPFAPRALAQDVFDSFDALARQRRLTLALEVAAGVPATVNGDMTRVAQVLGNLVGNALKFTERGSVQISVEPAPGGLRFSVTDTGVGIAPEFMQRMYDVFTQADSSSTRRHGGAGLGLAICKRLCDAMGGTIGASSQRGMGSTFWFELPLPAVESARMPVPVRTERRAPDEARRRVLIAEDNEVNRELLHYAVQGDRYEATMACDGVQAVERYRAARFDLVLMDLAMPGLDGLGAARAMRDWEREQALPRTPIIAVTAHAMDVDREACVRSGMDDVLPKPFTMAVLHELMDRWAARPS